MSLKVKNTTISLTWLNVLYDIYRNEDANPSLCICAHG